MVAANDIQKWVAPRHHYYVELNDPSVASKKEDHGGAVSSAADWEPIKPHTGIDKHSDEL